MSRIAVRAWGAVSPAGWGAPALSAAVERGLSLPTTTLAWPGTNKTLAVREVPPPSPRPAWLGHPRLRRASPITHYAAGAALEALGRAGVALAPPPTRLGLVVCMLAGCVQYSCRFFDETWRDPATASPLLFPETVFNAPTSHVAVVLGGVVEASTLLGDPGTFLHGLALAAEWLQQGRVDGCLVVGAEETNWLLASVLQCFDAGAVLAGGAGALYLEIAAPRALGVELGSITEAHLYSSTQDRNTAAARMRASLPPHHPLDLLCDSRLGRSRPDAAETRAWHDWTGPRRGPKAVFGDGLMASGAWQCVAACEALAQDGFRAANVSIVGANQQAIGARFVRFDTPDSSPGAGTASRPQLL